MKKSPRSKFERNVNCEHRSSYVILSKEGEDLFIKKAIKKYGIGLWKHRKDGGFFKDTVYFHDNKLTSYPVRVCAYKDNWRIGLNGKVSTLCKGKYTYSAELVPFDGY